MKSISNYARKINLVFLSILLCVSVLVGSLTTSSRKALAAPAILSGATMPYVELEAENATTNAIVIGPDRARWTLAGEAQGRRAVTLNATGHYVQFTLPASANSMVIRYSMPDSADGAGLTAPLSLYINGVRQTDLSLTSKYAWIYGGYPYNNVVSGGNAHRFYDESRFLLPAMTAGTTVRLQKDSTSTASSYTIDFADFEQVPAALTQPAGSASVVTFGADPTGVNDSTTAIQNAINGGGTIWLPAGTYKMGHIDIGANNITIKGAGIWHTTVKGLHASFAAPDGTARDNIRISDLSIFGENTYRIDEDRDEGIAGSWSNSNFSNIWIEHTKSGFFPNGATNNTTFSNFRIRNTYADGVNLWAGVHHTTVTQSNIRNTGDDGMAMFSTGAAGHDNTFSYNTVSLPNLANNIGIYGGYNNTVSNNLLLDTSWNGDGIQVANRFGAVPLTGTTTVTENTLIRTGSYQYDKGWPAAAILFFAEDSNMSSTINVTNNQIVDSTYAGINFAGSNITNVNLNNNNIMGAGTYGVQIQTSGAASFTSVKASQLGVGGTYRCVTNFTITQGTGNTGWNSTPVCPASWPNPVYSTVLPDGYTYCAMENETCSFNGVASVAFGANGVFNYGTFSNSVGCNTTVFGDPASGVRKLCLYKFTNGPTPTPCTTCPTNTNTPTPSKTVTNTPTPSPIPGTVVRAINAGGASTGGWVADTNFDSGNMFTDTSSAIDTTGWLDLNIAPQSVYQTARWNTAFTYTVTGLTANSSYVVLLHFAELSLNGVGARKFNVAINGTTVLSAFDVVAAAGFKRAIGKSFNATANASGNIVIAFTNGGADNPMVNGIEILQQSGATPTSTNTSLPATATRTPTITPTATRTNTPLPPTATPTRTNTPVSGQSPYGGTVWAIPGTIQAENFDLGGETIAYHDLETANQGGQYRTSDGVDIEATGDTGGGYNLGWTRTDEWLEYTVNVATAGTYTLTERVASGTTTGSFRVEFNGIDKTGNVVTPNTGGWQTWVNLSQTVTLSAGQQVMRIYFTGNDTNFNYISIASGGAPTATPTPNTTNLALNKAVTSSSDLSSLYAKGYAVDGNQGSYWESAAGFPQTLTVDLGTNYTVSRVVLKLPTGWGSRTQTLSILGSTDNVNYTTIVGSTVYTFSPSANTVTINFTGTSRRYIRINVTTNSGASGAQISELEVY